jgi:hypothetical protein
MKFSQVLSEVWATAREIGLECAQDLGDGLASAWQMSERTPKFWTWTTLWLAVVWISLRWTRLVFEASERRIMDTAESRLGGLVTEEAETQRQPDPVASN